MKLSMGKVPTGIFEEGSTWSMLNYRGIELFYPTGKI